VRYDVQNVFAARVRTCIRQFDSNNQLTDQPDVGNVNLEETKVVTAAGARRPEFHDGMPRKESCLGGATPRFLRGVDADHLPRERQPRAPRVLRVKRAVEEEQEVMVVVVVVVVSVCVVDKRWSRDCDWWTCGGGGWWW
jgi:hypothetical protein